MALKLFVAFQCHYFLMRGMFMKKLMAGMMLTLLTFLLVTGCGQEEVARINLTSIQANTEKIVEQPVSRDPETIYFGFDRRLEIKEDVKMYVPFLRYLESQTGYKFKLHVTPKNRSIVEELGAGVVQIAAVGTVSYLQAHEKYGVELIVRGRCANDGLYQSLIITRPSSDIYNLADLPGHSFAFGARNSTQGNLIARIMLAEAGISLEQFSRYDYLTSHAEVANAVMSGEFDAGAIQDTLGRFLAGRGLVRIVAQSKYYPSSGIAVNPNIQPEVIKKIRDALLAFDPQGKERDKLYNWDQSEMPNGFMPTSNEEYSELRRWAEQFGLLK